MKTQIITTIEKQVGKTTVEILVTENDKEADRLLIEQNETGSFIVSAGNGKFKELFNENHFKQ